MQVPPMLQSKKFLAALAAAVIGFFARREGMPLEDVAMIVGPLAVYVGAQGIADFGKERAKVDVAAAQSRTVRNQVTLSESRDLSHDPELLLRALRSAKGKAALREALGEAEADQS